MARADFLVAVLGAIHCTNLVLSAVFSGRALGDTAELVQAECQGEDDEDVDALDDASLLQYNHRQSVSSDARPGHIASGRNTVIDGHTAAENISRERAQSKATPANDSFWAGRGGNAARSGASPYAVAVWRKAVEGPTWNFTDMNMHVKSVPLIDHARSVYLVSIEGRILKLNEDGDHVWNITSGDNFAGNPTINEGRMFLATADGMLMAVDLATGKKLWRKSLAPCSAADGSSVTASDDVVFVAMSTRADYCLQNDRVIAVNSTTGEYKWTFHPTSRFHGLLPAIHNGSVVFADASGRAYRLDAETGREIWKSDGPGLHSIIDARPTSTVISPSGVVYVATGADPVPRRERQTVLGEFGVMVYLSALNFTTGEVLWFLDCAGSAPALGRLHPGGEGPLALVIATLGDSCPGANGSVFHDTSRMSRLIALDATTGKRLNWTFAPSTLQSEHDSAQKYGLPETSASEISAGVLLDTDISAPGCMPQSSSDPIMGGDGTVYISSKAGDFYAIRDKNGNGVINATDAGGEVVRIRTGGRHWHSLGIATGMLVASSCDGLRVFKDF